MQVVDLHQLGQGVQVTFFRGARRGLSFSHGQAYLGTATADSASGVSVVRAAAALACGVSFGLLLLPAGTTNGVNCGLLSFLLKLQTGSTLDSSSS